MADTRQHSVGGEAGCEIAGAAELDAAIAALKRLDASALQRRWRALVGGTLPKELGRPLTLRILAYKLQVERLGDLDRASQRELAAALESGANRKESHNQLGDLSLDVDGGKAEPPRQTRIARPGTLLVREHGGVLHRAMVLNEGVAWNGKTYDSLSQVAFAITGTRWNGPRFFGLRAETNRDGGRSKSSSADPRAEIRRRGAPKAGSSPGSRAPA